MPVVSLRTATQGSIYFSTTNDKQQALVDTLLASHIAQNPFSLSDLTIPEQYKQQEELQLRSYTNRDRDSEQFSKTVQSNIE